MKKFKVVTLGCRTNHYESEAFTDQLKLMGYLGVKEEEKADLCIVNTCTVTASADSHSRLEIRRLKKAHPDSKLVVTGCLATRDPESLRKMGEVDLIVLNPEKETLLEKVFPELEIPTFALTESSSHTRAFVKVQDGCESFCTYCILPYVRGKSKSRTLPEIEEELKRLVSHGKKEVVLTGINIGDFDGGGGKRLVDLVKMTDQIEGLERIRISSIDPDEVDDELIDAILKGKKTCPQMHIVLQSASNTILKRMNRKYTKQMFFETIERLKKASPHFGFTTDVIVGFPGETEDDFQETVDAIQEVGFLKVHMFPFSARERTRAALYPNKISPPVIQERKSKLLRLAEEVSMKVREAYVGEWAEVLLEGEDKTRPGNYTGYTRNFLPVSVFGEGLKNNTTVSVKLTSNEPDHLLGVYENQSC